MYIFKRKRGGTESKKYYCEFKDHLDTVRRVALSTDKRASEEMARNLERLVAYRKAKRPLDGALFAFVDGIDHELRTALGEWGIIDRLQTGAGIPLMVVKKVPSRNGAPAFEITGGHLAEYRASLQSRENSPHRILQVINRCRDIIKGCHFVSPSDIAAIKVERFLHSFRQEGRSAWTINGYQASFKAFCTWMVDAGIMSANPLFRLSSLNTAADRRHVRRALTDLEIARLISATESGGLEHGLTGHERALLYRLALGTGLRWNEIYTLIRSDFSFTESPSVTINAQNAKNGKSEALPLRPELARDIQAYFDANPALPSVRAFPNMWKKCGAIMLAKDLEAAGIERKNGQGIVDFHALRHTFGTLLARAGVAPKIAMDLMRHSDVNLTMALYSHTVLQDRASALEKISSVADRSSELRATGTMDAIAEDNPGCLKIVDSKTDSKRGQNRGILSHLESYKDEQICMESGVEKKIASPELTDTCDSLKLERAKRFEPSTLTLAR